MINPRVNHFILLRVNVKLKNLLILFLLNEGNLKISVGQSSFRRGSFLKSNNQLLVQEFLLRVSFQELDNTIKKQNLT